MGDNSAIEWTDATWNPIVGCSVVSPGCANCYAMRQAARIEAMYVGRHLKHGNGAPFQPSPYAGTTQPSKAGAVWTGKVAIVNDHDLTRPLRWTRPRRIFVNSMSDMFHESVPDAWIDRVFAVMALAPQHMFQVLTKRSRRMRDYVSTRAGDYILALTRAIDDAKLGPWASHPVPSVVRWPLFNVWLGVSAEDQIRADERLPDLRATPSAVRFVSAEPLLGPINFCLPKTHLDWIIVGGESGPQARPMSTQWVREIRDQSAAAHVPFFFKQWGEWAPARFRQSGAPGVFAFGDYWNDRTKMIRVDAYPREFTRFGARSLLERVGKAAAGRLLDGVEHNGLPEAHACAA